MPAYCSAIVTASSQGGALGGTYTATLGAFSSGTASMLLASISPRMAVTRVSYRLERDARERRVAPDGGPVRQQERSAAIVQKPLGLDSRLHDAIRDAVRLEV